MPRNTHVSLFDRLRRPAALRVVLVLAALLASQDSLACAFEEAFSSQATEISAVAGSQESLDDSAATNGASGAGNCSMCVDCASCGGCCSFAAAPRGNNAQAGFAFVFSAKITFATAAPTHWTPPTLLRPPIRPA